MPASSPAALARRRERRAERQAERRADPAFRERENAARRIGGPRPPAKPKWRQAYDAPFVGCDGEATTDPATGEHRYCLFRMGTRELFKGGRRLTTPELLKFILDHPDPHDYLVGFFFEYDANCILLDVPRERRSPDTPSRLEHLLQIESNNWQQLDNPYAGERRPGRKPADKKGMSWTWLNFDGYREFGVMWLGGNHLKVCWAMANPRYGKRDRKGKLDKRRTVAAPDTTRTIYDVGRNFTGSFVQALEAWGIGARAVVQEIAATKDKREQFATITPAIRRYNALECALLAEMMEAFRAASIAAGIVPRTWNGAGKLAAALLNQSGAVKRKDYEERFPAGVRGLARDAFYGARFETTRAGLVDQPVHALDINSAFPAAMLKLPCLHHGRFRRASADTLEQAPNALYVARVRFDHPATQFLCGLPVRTRHGPICWPRQGAGVYWSPELRSARRLGAKLELLGGWLYERRCRCRPYSIVRRIYGERLKLGADSRGIPLKLGMNAMYGKVVQRVGAKTYANHVHGGLITALVRAQINDAIRTAGPRNVVMVAADALFTVRRRPDVAIDGAGEKRLGAWGAKVHPDLFIVQPGLYWPNGPGRKLKTRGVGRKFFKPEIVERFETAWLDYLETLRVGSLYSTRRRPGEPPALDVPVRAFISLRLAYRLKDPAIGAHWLDFKRRISFGWQSKRRFERLTPDGLAAILGPLAGGPDLVSMTYDEQGKRTVVQLGADGELVGGELLPSDMKELFEAMPDPVDLSAFTDE